MTSDKSEGTVPAYSILNTMLEEALRERGEARRDLVASEELHRRRFGSLKAEFEQVMRERDEARKELEEALQRLSLWEGAVMRMKKQLSFAPPFRTEEAK